MSRIALSPPASGTATFTLSAPATNTDRTLTLPDTTAPILAGSGITLSASAPANTLVTTDAGNVGIGTSSPVRPLVIRTGASVSSVIKLANADSGETLTDGLDLAFDGSNGYLNLRESGFLALSTNNTERARITSSGNLLIGTTFEFSARAAFAGTGTVITYYTSGGSGTKFCEFLNAVGSEVGSITQNGGSATSYNTSSDYRLKESIAPMTGALAKVAALKPCTYTWKSTGEQSQGFIAHELQAVVPDAVTGEKDAVNEDGSIKPQGIDTSFLVATLTAAIQELNAKVDAQAAEIAALKGQA